MRYRPETERFWEFVNKTDGCWLWTGAPSTTGYGGFHRHRPRRQVQAHRYAYELLVGPIPEGLCVLHRCDVRPCVNPAHLWLGTRLDNGRDMARKGRSAMTVHPEAANRGESHYRAKMTNAKVIELRAMREDGWTYADLGRYFDITWTAVRKIALRKRWAHV